MSSFSDSTTLQKSAASNKSRGWLLLLLALGLIGLLIFSLFLGRYPQTGLIAWERLKGDALARMLVFNLRLPRLLTAAALGMSLAASGLVFQMLFGNPLVEPGFLGVSQGAAFGAALCIVFFNGSALWIQTCAAGFALAGFAPFRPKIH